MFNGNEALYLKMARLHIWRTKGRAMLIALMISLSLVGLLLMEGVYEGMMVQMTQRAIKTGCGTVSIQDREFRAEGTIKANISSPETVTGLLERKPEVVSYVERVTLRGLVATAGYSQSVTVMGVDPESEKRQGQLDSFMIEGEYSFGKRQRGAIIGYRLARKLKAGIGKKVVVTMQDTANEVVSVALKVNGIIKTSSNAIDANGVLMDLGRLQRLTSLKGVTEIAVILADQDADMAFKHELTKELDDPELAVYSYKDLFPSLYEGEQMMQTYNEISSAFIFIVATLGIFGVVLVSVLERIREFGIMMAVGTEFRDIARLIVYESLMITMSGYLVGAALGGGLLWYFKVYGLDLSGFSDAFAIFGMDANIYAIMKQEYFTSSFVSVIVATLAATVIPIVTLKRRNPIQAINENAQ